MKVLCGWELGAGLGHVSRLKPIVMAIRDAGADVVVGLQDKRLSSSFLGPDGVSPLSNVSIISVPVWPMPKDPAARELPTDSFADVMHLIGYNRAGQIEERARQWMAIIEKEKPDIILGDFAPTLNIAARGMVPLVMVGNGYTIPPGGRSLPPIRPWQENLDQFSLDHEAEVLAAVNTALKALGKSPMEYLGDLFNGDRTFVFSLPLVDPYAKYRDRAQLPPFNLPKDIKCRPTSARRPDRAVFYFPASHPHLLTAIDAAKQSGLKFSAYVSGLSSEMIAKHKTGKFRLSDTPLNFSKELPSARVVFHHGGLSTAVAATQAGTPQLVLPWNLEHHVTAKCVEVLGATKIPFGENLRTERLATGLKNIAVSRELQSNAIAAAGKVDLTGMENGARVVADSCFELVSA